MATLYYSLQVGEVHAGKNSFPGNYVDLGSGLTAPGIPEWQDAGTVNWTAYFNNQARPDEVWRHFTVSSETFDRPSDYGSVISWDTLFFVNQQTASFPKWAAVKVNDSFVIPSQYDLAPGWTSGEPTATESG
ncbi:hypothetical protein IVA86_40990 [Bradyrhizobium sp. 146]|nr:hypothetical protein [Bradyrhizobium sp. 146]